MRRRKRKNNIIWTLTLISALIIITLLPLPVAEAASFTVSKTNISLENGKNSTITINAPTHTGRLDITSSNSGVASSSESSLWVENNSKTITISAKSAGTTVITIKGELYDSSTESEETFTKTINVSVSKGTTLGSNNTTGGSSSNGSTSNGSTGSGNGGSNGSVSNGSSSNNSGSSGGQNSSSKPSSGAQNSSSKPSSSGSANTSTSKPSESINSNNTASNEQTTNETLIEPSDEEIVQIEEVETENIEESNEEENQNEQAEINPENLEDINIEESGNIEHTNLVNFKSNVIIVAGIALAGLTITGIGIGMKKKIFKK